MPKGVFVIRGFFSVLFMFFSIPAFSCSCSIPELNERVAGAGTIVVGRIVQLEENEAGNVHQTLKGKVAVKEVLKGQPAEEFYLMTGYGEGDCGLGFRVRDEYIFFLNENKIVIGCEGHILNLYTGSRPSCFGGTADSTFKRRIKEVKALIKNGI